jgi:hypothetical protein
VHLGIQTGEDDDKKIKTLSEIKNFEAARREKHVTVDIPAMEIPKMEEDNEKLYDGNVTVHNLNDVFQLILMEINFPKWRTRTKLCEIINGIKYQRA